MAVAPPLLDKATFKIFHSVNKRVEIVNIFFFFKNLGFLLFLPFDIFSICIQIYHHPTGYPPIGHYFLQNAQDMWNCIIL